MFVQPVRAQACGFDAPQGTAALRADTDDHVDAAHRRTGWPEQAEQMQRSSHLTLAV